MRRSRATTLVEWPDTGLRELFAARRRPAWCSEIRWKIELLRRARERRWRDYIRDQARMKSTLTHQPN